MSRPETTVRIPGEARTKRLSAAPEGRLVLGRYRLEQRLGAGGFGVVWRAHDERLERDVAVKVLPSEGGEDARVQREALAAAQLNHPSIVALYELGRDDHAAYLVSELVDGATLAELSQAGAVSDRDVARIGAALCDALEHAHARGVVHRDVKPGNVMVLAEPAAGAGFAKLTDFGIAHLASSDTLTAPGDVVGTLAYMAPEQAEGRRVGPETDVYSLTLTLYEAWTGSNPVRANSPAATARRVGEPLPPLRSRRRDLPAALCEVVDAALDPDPAYRPQLAELREVLRDAEGELFDEGGLVEAETIERFGLTAVRPRTRLTQILRTARSPVAADGFEQQRRPLAPLVAARAGAGLAAGLLVLAALESIGPGPPFSVTVAAGAAALAVALLPRVGWIAAAMGVCAWLASPEAGCEGTALVLTAALLPIPLLLPRAGLLWSVPALAPLLGAVALAPLFVGVASLCSTAWRRAGLAAAGFYWVVIAEALTGSDLLFGVADGTAPRSGWEASVVDATNDALVPIVSSPVLLGAALWAAFAVVLPLLVRGRWTAMDVAAGALWAIGLVLALDAFGDLLDGATALDGARGALAGSCLAAAVAVTMAAIAPPVAAEEGEAALP